jgi:hypothetical protein
VGSSADLLAGQERSLRELLDSTDSFPIDVGIAVTLRAIAAVHAAHGQYAPRYGRLSPGAVALDFTGNVRIDWESDCDDAFVVHDAKLDRRSDVLVLGLLLHGLVTTGRDEAELPVGLGDIIAKATATQAMDRYQTAIAMHGALDRFANSIHLRTGNQAIVAFMLRQLGMPDVVQPVTLRLPTISSGVPREIVDTPRTVTARIPIATGPKTGRIAILPIIAPVDQRARPRTVQIPARGTSPNPLMPPLTMPAEGTGETACDDGWELPEPPALEPPPPVLVAPRPATDPAEVYELDDADLEVAEVWPD